MGLQRTFHSRSQDEHSTVLSSSTFQHLVSKNHCNSNTEQHTSHTKESDPIAANQASTMGEGGKR